jgi:tetratricopeptide (TPR) repeat protein
MSDLPSDDARLLAARAEAARGEWGAARERLTAVPAEARSVEVSLFLAEACLRTGHLAEAHALLGPVAEALAAQGNTAVRRRAVNMQGAAAFELGMTAESERSFREALALANAADDPLTLGRATNNLGMIAHIRGAYDESLSLYRLAVPAYQRLGFTVGLAETHHNMALALRELEQLDAADRQERRAIEFARDAGNARLLAIAHVGRAELSLRRGEAAVAHAGARMGAEEYAAIPDAIGEADALRLLGAACAALGEMPAAEGALARAVDLAHRHGSPLIEAEARESRARVHLAAGRRAEAQAEGTEAQRLYRQLGATSAAAALARWLEAAGGEEG